MAILFIHDESEDSLANYDEGIRRLEAVGEGHPSGRLFHTAARKGQGYLVVDLWESQEAMERFGRILMPILEQLGSPNATPLVLPVHNIIQAD
ncbi:MAG TPA: hypothetical protein VH186_34145 [Chloroflexia bacterium]|nr:hypothetical protein [Chloroflexia bacterium]